MKKVLIADDSPSIRRMLSTVLADNGYDVTEAENGKEAFAKAQQTKPDMVITDLNMPEENGYALVKNLRQNAASRFIPILVLTTEDEKEKKMAGKAAGATGWLVKPFNPDKLLELVNRLTNR